MPTRRRAYLTLLTLPPSRPPRSSLQEVNADVAKDGLKRAEFKGNLGKGAFGNVELVAISLPDGTVLEAARKTVLPCTGGTAELCCLLQQELDGLAAAEGCQYAVQCLGFRMPTAEGEPAELLLTYAKGGSMEDFLVGAGWLQHVWLAMVDKFGQL